ncbi:O-acyltransferase like protein-like [Saccostrea cucullata]|uniref:O-acyltransferase like protein-like n=1 Tax=Saccostrea cuccullata TaxID=36930 RepID=UPI002ED5F8A1
MRLSVLAGALSLFVLVSWGTIPTVQSQSLDGIVAAINQMNTTAKIALMADFLIRTPVLYNKLEKILLGALPLVSVVKIRPEINRFLLPWVLDKIPEVLKSELLLNVTRVVVNEVNHVNITGLNTSGIDPFMAGFISRFDLVHTGMLSLDVVLDSLLPSFGIGQQIKEFVTIFGEKISHVIIKQIQSEQFNHSSTVQSLNHSTAQSVSIETIIRQMNITQKIGLMADILIQQPELFNKLEKILLGALPLISVVKIRPEINRFLLPWVLDKIPEVLKSELLLNVTRVVVNEVNHVNITGLNTSGIDPFMAGFISRFDLLHTGMLSLDVVLDSLLPSFGIGQQIKEFVKSNGEKISRVIIKQIQSDIRSQLQVTANSTSDTKMSQSSLLQLGVGILQTILTPMENVFPKPQRSTLTDQCYSDSMIFLNNLLRGKKWAVQMFDSAGKPPTGTLTGNLHFIGSYDQCLSITPQSSSDGGQLTTTDTRYCRATFDIPDSLMASVTSLIGDVNTYGVPITLTEGLCLPASCQEGDVKELFKLGLLKSFNLAPSVECSNSYSLEKDRDAIIVIIILCVVAFVCIMATLFHIYRFSEDDEELRVFSPSLPEAYDNRGYESEMKETQFSTEKRNGHTTGNGHLHSEDVDIESLDKSSTEKYEGAKEGVTKSFSLYQNLPDVLSFDHPKDSIQCLHGIRFLSLAWLVLGDTFLYAALSLNKSPVTGNLLEGLNMLKQFTFQAVFSSPFAIDSFFVISGFLVTYRFLRKCTRKQKLKWQSIVGFYSNRYIRITPVYIIIMMVYTCFYHYLGDSPLYPQSIAVADKCKENWWHHILYINNIVGTTGNTAFEQCMPWSWFLACLMQFYLITPILIVFYLWSSVLGSVIVGLLLAASVVATAIKEKMYTGDIMSTMSDGGDYWNNVFITPWCRVGVYCIGILLGFVFDTYDSREKVKMNKVVNLFGWLFSLGLMITLAYSPFTKHREGGYSWTPLQSEVYEAVSHVVWALALSWVIFACAKDHGGIVNWILSWRGFLPLSRLSYVVYLIHPVVMVAFVYNKKVLIYMNNLEMAYMFLGHLISSFAVGTLFSVGIELPFIRLLKLLKRRGCSSNC